MEILFPFQYDSPQFQLKLDEYGKINEKISESAKVLLCSVENYISKGQGFLEAINQLESLMNGLYTEPALQSNLIPSITIDRYMCKVFD